MVNKILDTGDNCKWILYHLDNYISCNLHPLKKRTAKACIIEIHKDDNIIKLCDGYYKVYAHLNNKAIRSLSSLESLEEKKHKYPVVHINNFQFEIKLSKFYKKYDSELNKTKYILMLETPEIELTGEYCKIKNKGTDVMELDTVKELLENTYKKDEKKYNNYYKNINEEKSVESQESANSTIPLSNPSISSPSKEIEEKEGKEEKEEEKVEDGNDDNDEEGEENDDEEEEGDDNNNNDNNEEDDDDEEEEEGDDNNNNDNNEEDDDDDEEEEEEEKNKDNDEEEEVEEDNNNDNDEEEEEEKKNIREEEEDDDEPETQLSPIRRKNTIIVESPLPIKVINEKIQNDISSIHTLPSSIISTHSSIWITNNKNKNSNIINNITPSASYTVLSILDKGNENNTNNKIDEDNNERVINIDDILPRGPDIERTKRNEEKNLNKNKNKKVNSVSMEKEKESENQFEHVESDIVDLIVDKKKLKIQFNCAINLNSKAEKRKIDDQENELELFRQNYMRKMRRLVESRRK